jgi:hypothetical protein
MRTKAIIERKFLWLREGASPEIRTAVTPDLPEARAIASARGLTALHFDDIG